jgi:hypothetical protein
MLRITTILALLSLAVAAAADDVSARRAVLLDELAQCLSTLPKDVEYFDSPCAEKNVEPLAGGSEQEVVGKLGAPAVLHTGNGGHAPVE